MLTDGVIPSLHIDYKNTRIPSMVRRVGNEKQLSGATSGHTDARNSSRVFPQQEVPEMLRFVVFC